MNLKAHIRNLQPSDSLFKRSIYSCFKKASQCRLFITNERYRSEVITRWKYGRKHHQGATFTKKDRYPLIFKECARILLDIENPYILSFGCSTGEEVLTIGSYIPTANIMGVDINPWCIQQCRKQYADKRFSFHHRFSDEFMAAMDFDAIFCMAVFQHTTNRSNADKQTASGFTFEQFEKEIYLLDSKLKAGALLIIDHADFSLMDTIVASHYQPVNFEKNQMLRYRPLFNKNNEKIAETTNIYRVFVKNNPFQYNH